MWLHARACCLLFLLWFATHHKSTKHKKISGNMRFRERNFFCVLSFLRRASHLRFLFEHLSFLSVLLLPQFTASQEPFVASNFHSSLMLIFVIIIVFCYRDCVLLDCNIFFFYFATVLL